MYLVLAIIVGGMLIGWLAQLLLGQRYDQINWPLTLGAGIGGSLLGGLFSTLLAGDGFNFHPAGFIGSVLGAIVITALYHVNERRKHAKR